MNKEIYKIGDKVVGLCKNQFYNKIGYVVNYVKFPTYNNYLIQFGSDSITHEYSSHYLRLLIDCPKYLRNE